MRKIISFSARITSVTEEEIAQIEKDAYQLFHSCVYYGSRLSPTMFCLTKVMPAHAKLCFTKFNFGIGCNTMEGREQKHQKVEKYQHHSTFDRRWQMAFRHEFIELIYLRENGFDKVKYSKRSRNYIPDPPPNSCESCLSTLNSSNRCVICDHKVMKEINSTLETPGWSS